MKKSLIAGASVEALGMAILDAPKELQKSPLAANSYKHYLLARYLVCVGSEEEKTAYFLYADSWTNLDHGYLPGHPWPQIQYFRWLLAEDEAELKKDLKKTLHTARGNYNMPTVDLIAFAIAISMGILNPSNSDVRAVLLKLDVILPGASTLIYQLLAAEPGDRYLAKRILPFNFC